MNSIQGPGNIAYEARHLQVSRRLTAESVKPDVFKDDAQQAKIDLKDQVALSGEAKELLKQLRKEDKKIASSKDDNFESLLGSLKKLKNKQEEDEDDGEGNNPKKESKGKRLLFRQSSDGKYIIPITQTLAEENGKPKRAVKLYRNREIIERMLVPDTTNEQKRLIVSELDAMGEKTLKFVKNFGIHIMILKKSENLTQRRINGMMIVVPGEKTFDGRPWEIVRGIYCSDWKLIVVGEEQLGRGPKSAVRHEFGHAFDNAFSVKNQRRLALSVQLWNSFSSTRKALPSQYASTNPAEYFAESVDTYFIPEGREYIKKNDPQMHEYLEILFSEE